VNDNLLVADHLVAVDHKSRALAKNNAPTTRTRLGGAGLPPEVLDLVDLRSAAGAIVPKPDKKRAVDKAPLAEAHDERIDEHDLRHRPIREFVLQLAENRIKTDEASQPVGVEEGKEERYEGVLSGHCILVHTSQWTFEERPRVCAATGFVTSHLTR